MASTDLLEKLFDVEREAESIVARARDEADRLLDSAKVMAQRLYTEAYDAALAKALAAREESEKAAKADYESAIETFRAKLAASRLDRAAFAAACEEALASFLATPDDRQEESGHESVASREGGAVP